MKTNTNATTGKIASIRDCGSIIMVSLRTDEGWSTPVFFDHTPFRWMVESLGCQAGDLIGRQVEYDGEMLSFLD